MFSNFCNAAYTHEYKWTDVRTRHDVFQYKDLEKKNVNIYVTEIIMCGAIIHLCERLCHVI